MPQARAASRKTRIQTQNEGLILDAALEVFSAYGFRGATVDQIAAGCGLSKPNLLYYFRRKEDIYRAVLERTLTAWLVPLRAFDPDGDPVAELSRYVSEKLRLSRENPKASRLFANEILHGAPVIGKFLKGPLRELVDKEAAIIRGWMTAGRIATIDPYHLRFSPDMKWLVTVANRLDHMDLYRWDGSNPSLVKRLPSAKTPSHIWIDSKSTTMYSTMQESNELVAVDLATQSMRWRVPTGSLPADVFGTPDDKYLLVANTGGFDVQVFDISVNPARLVKTIRTGEGAHAFRAMGDGKHVLVSNRVADTISRIDYTRLEVVGEYKAPGGPDCMEVTPDGKLLVSSRWVKRMTVVDTASGRIERQVKVGKSPHGVWTLNHTQRQ